MGRKTAPLSDTQVRGASAPGRYADGHGLYLVVRPGGSKGWAFISRRRGKQREWSLGGYPEVSLKVARVRAMEYKALVDAGEDPRAAGRESVRIPTFGEVADAYIAAHAPSWRNDKHRAQWDMTLQKYAAPLRGKQVDRITLDDVLGVLKPLWLKIPETAGRLRGRIEVVLDAARAQGLCRGENPARWRGHLDKLLPRRKKLTRGNHKALPLDTLPGFMADLRSMDSIGARALEFTILTAARSGEVLGARWDEVDLRSQTWVVPASRMKGGREHRVPLASAALLILKELEADRNSEFIFPGQKTERGLSAMSMAMVLRRMKVEVTVHGFRSTFSDWCSERTGYPSEVREMALAHAIGNKSEAAYRRGDVLEKRRSLMQDWAAFCGGI